MSHGRKLWILRCSSLNIYQVVLLLQFYCKILIPCTDWMMKAYYYKTDEEEVWLEVNRILFTIKTSEYHRLQAVELLNSKWNLSNLLPHKISDKYKLVCSSAHHTQRHSEQFTYNWKVPPTRQNLKHCQKFNICTALIRTKASIICRLS
jgi:hypothetical protein